MAVGSGTGAYEGLGGRDGSAKGAGNIRGRLSRMEALLPLAGDVLVDIGCGNGAYTMEMAPSFKNTLAIDIEPDRLADFRASCSDPRIQIRQGSAADTGLAAASVDAVTAIEVLEHLGDQLLPVLCEIHRILRPGGSLHVTTPNRWWPLEQHGFVVRGRRRPGWQFPFLTYVPSIHRRFSPDAVFTASQLEAIVGPIGFANVGVRHMMPPLDGSPALRRYAGPVLAQIENTRLGFVSQTLVMAFKRL